MNTITSLEAQLHTQPFPTSEVDRILRSMAAVDRQNIRMSLEERANTAANATDSASLLYWSRILVAYGKIYEDPYAQAFGYYYNAYQKYSEQLFPESLTALERARAYLSNTPTKQQYIRLLGYIHILFAHVYSSTDNHLIAQTHCKEAEALFTTLNDVTGLEHVAVMKQRQSITAVGPSTIQTATAKLHELQREIELQNSELSKLSVRQAQLIAENDRLVAAHTVQLAASNSELVRSQSLLEETQQRIDALTASYTERLRAINDSLHMMQSEHDAKLQQLTDAHNAALQNAQAKYAELESSLQQREQHALAQATLLEQRLNELQLRERTARELLIAPLWVQLARAEIASGIISHDTYTMLSRLSSLVEGEASALLIEIQARSNTHVTVPYDLNTLQGEARLHAARVNAHLLLANNKTAALETLVDAWEVFSGSKA